MRRIAPGTGNPLAFAGTVKLVRRGQRRQSGWAPALRGAVTGAVVVVVVAGLGSLIEGLAPTPVLVAVGVAGAIFGALAWSAISYDRRTRTPIGGPS